MAEVPYCPVLSINKDVPVLCQEELCMWYVKQLKLCSITVLAYTNAVGVQSTIPSPTSSKGQNPVTQPKPQVKQSLTKEKPKDQPQPQSNPFALDDLE